MVWFTTALKMLAAISSLRAPWFSKGWMSVLANTPQRDAIEYSFLLCSLNLLSSSGVILSRVAIWSINAPVPPAQEPFMRSSRPPEKNIILASSPPSSITTSVSGWKRSTAPAVANTSCTNSRLAALATPSPAEPVMARLTCLPLSLGFSCSSISAVFSRTLDMWRSYVLNTISSLSLSSTTFTVVDPISIPIRKFGPPNRIKSPGIYCTIKKFPSDRTNFCSYFCIISFRFKKGKSNKLGVAGYGVTNHWHFIYI